MLGFSQTCQGVDLPFGVLNFKQRYDFRLHTLCYSRTVTMFTEKIIVDSEYIENISLSELQPPQFRKICYVLFGSFLHVLVYYVTVLCCSFFLFFLSLFFFLSCFFLILFVSVHKISILSSLPL